MSCALQHLSWTEKDQAAARKCRRQGQDDISRRAGSAERLPLLGELSAGRQALEGIQVHQGKTKVWNRAGAEPEACSSMQEAAQRVDPDARVWTGDGPLSQQGLRVLGDPNWHSRVCAITIGADQFEAQGSLQPAHPC